MDGYMVHLDKHLDENFSNSCLLFQTGKAKLNDPDSVGRVSTDCSSWETTGRSLKTPQQPRSVEKQLAKDQSQPELSVYQLSYGDTFLYKGKVEFKYRANTALINHKTPNGIFKFTIDGKHKKPLSDHLLQGQWVTVSYEVPPGFHRFEWSYSKYVNLQFETMEDLNAEIEYIKITGTSYSPHTC